MLNSADAPITHSRLLCVHPIMLCCGLIVGYAEQFLLFSSVKQGSHRPQTQPLGSYFKHTLFLVAIYCFFSNTR